MTPPANPDPRRQPRHTIAVVARRTGLSQLVLRAWETRYAAVTPQRTPTGRRRYSDLDLEKLMLLSRLTGSGHRIGDIARLPLAELEELARESLAAGALPPPPPPTGRAAAADLLQEALQAVTELDARRLEGVLDRALVALSKPELRRDLLVPLLVEIGNRWSDGRLRVAHEHLATSLVQAFLTSLNARYRVAPGAPILAVATPAGQMHELGALLAASHAHEAGWDVLYLGPDLPAEEIVAAFHSRGARSVLLSLVFPQGDVRTAAELRELRRLLGADVPLLIGGQAVPSYAEVLTEIGARVFLDPEELERSLALG